MVLTFIILKVEKMYFFGLGTFQLTYVPTIFVTSRKMVLDPNRPFISTSQTKLRNAHLFLDCNQT